VNRSRSAHLSFSNSCAQAMAKCMVLLMFSSLMESGIAKVALIRTVLPEPEPAGGNLRGGSELFTGVFSAFAPAVTPKGTVPGWVPSDPYGCKDYQMPDALTDGSSGVAVVRRGDNCTFEHKAEQAQRAGAEGVIIVSNGSIMFVMGADNRSKSSTDIKIMVIEVTKETGNKIIDASHGGIMFSFEVYERPMPDLAEIMIIFLGTGLVAAGAYFSTSDLSTQGSFQAAVQPVQEEVMEVDYYLAIGFFCFGSMFLVILYFFMWILIYVIIFVFCIGGFNTLTQIGSIFLQWALPPLRSKLCAIPSVGLVLSADVVAGVPSLAAVIAWVVLRNTTYAWPFQDLIGAGFLCWLQRTMRLPNIKVATLFLCIMFFFDIFWVFISPLLFQKSVMVEVATGGDTGEHVPMLMRVPAIGDPLGRDRMLGFGDIALPGLLVSYLRRHDLLSSRAWCRGYFLPSLIGYFVGLCCTIVALTIMQMGQPALLYLVPGTLGTTVVLSCCRGELGDLWEGRPCGSEAKTGSSTQSSGSSTQSSGNDDL